MSPEHVGLLRSCWPAHVVKVLTNIEDHVGLHCVKNSGSDVLWVKSYFSMLTTSPESMWRPPDHGAPTTTYHLCQKWRFGDQKIDLASFWSKNPFKLILFVRFSLPSCRYLDLQRLFDLKKFGYFCWKLFGALLGKHKVRNVKRTTFSRKKMTNFETSAETF